MMTKTIGKAALADRLAEIRRDLYGDAGLKILAQTLGIPARTWQNYEWGVTVPGEVLLRFVVLTRANPQWLLTGKGAPLACDQKD